MVTGLVLLIATPTLTCCVAALAQPDHPYGIDRQRAAFDTLVHAVLVANCVALVAAWLLIAYGFVTWRRRRAESRWPDGTP